MRRIEVTGMKRAVEIGTEQRGTPTKINMANKPNETDLYATQSGRYKQNREQKGAAKHDQ